MPNYNRLQKKIHYLKLNFDFDIEKFNSKRNEIKDVIELINKNENLEGCYQKEELEDLFFISDRIINQTKILESNHTIDIMNLGNCMYLAVYFCKLLTSYKKKTNVNFYDVSVNSLSESKEITIQNYNNIKNKILDLFDNKIYDKLLNKDDYELYMIDNVYSGISFTCFIKILYLYLSLTYPNQIDKILRKIKFIGFVNNNKIKKPDIINLFEKNKVYDIPYDSVLNKYFVNFFERNLVLLEEEGCFQYIIFRDDHERCVDSIPISENNLIDAKQIKSEIVTEECYIVQFLLYNFFMNILTMTKKEKNRYYKKYMKYKIKYMNVRSIFTFSYI